jgi:hypothetical protein
MWRVWGRGFFLGALALVGSSLEAANFPLLAPTSPEHPAPEALQLGSILSVVPERCALRYTVRVVAPPGEGEDAFTVEVWDEGQPVRVVGLSVPADGNTHELSGRIELPPVSEKSPGVALVLKDGPSVLDVEDPVLAPCVAADVPAANSEGLMVLALLLGGLGLFVFPRLRSVTTL